MRHEETRGNERRSKDIEGDSEKTEKIKGAKKIDEMRGVEWSGVEGK